MTHEYRSVRSNDVIYNTQNNRDTMTTRALFPHRVRIFCVCVLLCMNETIHQYHPDRFRFIFFLLVRNARSPR